MLGQDLYQICVMLFLLCFPHKIPDIDDGDDVHLKGSVHYTIIFNALVMMTLFNEINARKLLGEWNPFTGILQNSIFLGLWAFEMAMQVLMILVGGKLLACHPDGLTAVQWGLCFAFGVGTMVWQWVINVASWLLRESTSQTGLTGSSIRHFGQNNNQPPQRRDSMKQRASQLGAGATGSGTANAWTDGSCKSK